MKKTLTIIGTGIVVSIAAYVAWCKLHKKDKAILSNAKNTTDNISSKEPASEITQEIIVENEVNSIKSNVGQNIYSRHEEAAQIMKDAVDIIYKRSEVAGDENKDFEQISSELNNLLSED